MMNWSKLLNSNRKGKSATKGDRRSEFQRDYDRSIFSAPVKRLQDKAQVFPLEPIDSVRNRLTHSLEVASVARGLAREVGNLLLKEKKIEPEQASEIETIAMTCGLIHDLGNPPFGHSGEDAIQEWFKKDNRLDSVGAGAKRCDFEFFEGNAQTLRILSRLQIQATFNGLNLTYGTLSASCKYIASSDDRQSDDHAKSKPGYFQSEKELIDEIRDKVGTGCARNPITYIVEAADDIVYSVADLEDGIKKGIMTWEELSALLPDCNLCSSVISKKDEILKVANENGISVSDNMHASVFRVASIAKAVESAGTSFVDNYDKIMNGEYKGELVKEGDAMPYIYGLKMIGQKKVYCTPETLKLELMGRRVIHDLMDIFWEGIESLPENEDDFPVKGFSGKLGALLSDNYRVVYYNSLKEGKLPAEYCRYQLLTDYICGMTDTFAKRLHAELTNGC